MTLFFKKNLFILHLLSHLFKLQFLENALQKSKRQEICEQKRAGHRKQLKIISEEILSFLDVGLSKKNFDPDGKNLRPASFVCICKYSWYVNLRPCNLYKIGSLQNSRKEKNHFKTFSMTSYYLKLPVGEVVISGTHVVKGTL